MHRYLIKFNKSGLIRYTSHLDMIRLFHRAFKRIGISLAYSRGFNPHPKMSFAQPLSLGYTSIGEYLECETTKPYMTDKVKNDLNDTLPEGIEITGCWVLPESKKSIASLVTWASYEITCKGKFQPSFDLIECFLNQDNIVTQKKQKNKKIKDVDIKPLIRELKILREKKSEVVIFTMIRAGSDANLNPDFLMSAFSTYAQTNYDKIDFEIKRLEIFDSEFQPIQLKVINNIF